MSAYNSRANTIVEHQHHTICDLLVKTCKGDLSQRPSVMPFIFWADGITTRKATRHMPYYMAYGIEPILPFNITQATFLVPDMVEPIITNDLIARHTRHLKKHPTDLATIWEQVLTSRLTSGSQFKKHFMHSLHNVDFAVGVLILV